MTIEIQEKQPDAQQPVIEVPTTQDGWAQAFDDIIHGDFSGISLVIVLVLGFILMRPILFLLKYAIAAFVIFLIVKYFLYYDTGVY